MFVKSYLPAILALGATVVRAADCEEDYTINSSADASQISSCDSISGTVTIGPEASGAIALDGPTSISGDLICEDNGVLTSLSSSSLESIGGSFTMNNVTGLISVSMDSLTSVETINWVTLARLETVSFSLSSADSITISDTFMSSLNSFAVTSAKSMDINNNRRLTEWDSSLKTLSDHLIINSNGFGLAVTFDDLVWISNMTISNVSSITVPSLEVVNGTMAFSANYFSDFNAPNMTNTVDGDISFTDNSDLTNITFPALTSIGGGFTIANNTGLTKIDGFPELSTIGGAVKLRGNFTEVELPSLSDVKGAFDIASTNNIDDTCSTFNALAPSSDGGNGVIQGQYTCTSEDEDANDVNSEGSDSNSSNDESSAASYSLPLTLALAAFGFALL